MTCAVVYSSRTGNTKLLAETVKKEIKETKGIQCIYYGEPGTEALKAERIYVGFWTDKGNCNAETAEFLKKVTNQQIYLFGTAGFGDSQEYFDKVLERTGANLGPDARKIGSFMCQGKMPVSVRQRYEKMMNSPVRMPNLQGLIENFDKALSHPDEKDLEALIKSVNSLL